LLVVTFTNLAAAQMRQRIGTALAGRLADHPTARIRRQLLLLNVAAINTLHAFCLDLVRSHYYRLGLAPGFRVAGEDEADLIRRRVLEDLLEKCYEAASPDFLTLVDDYGGEKGDDRLAELVWSLYDFARSHPDPEAWLAAAAGAFAPGGGLDDLAWSGAVREALGTALAGARDFLVQGLRLAEAGPDVYVPVLSRDLDRLAVLGENLDRPFAELRTYFSAFTWDRLPACRGVDEEAKERVRSLRDRAKEALRQARDRFLQRETDGIMADHALLAPRMATLVDLVTAFADGYREAKAKRGLVDFGDLEHFALRLLSGPEGTPSDLALACRERYVEVLVDEYQDINPVQEAIIRLVSRPGNLFMVGDIKQSIYRFRLAEPGLFLAKYRHFSPSPGAAQRRIDLPENFRSRPEIIRAVNFLFRQIMTPASGEMAYGPQEELACGLARPATGTEPVELYLLDARGGDEEDLSAVEREARLVAGRIREMMAGDTRIREDGRDRPLSYGDLVVLLRAARGAADSFIREFRRQGIPAQGADPYSAAAEVETMLSLLRVIDNPLQDIPLAAVLRSPVVGLGAAGLAEIRRAVPDGDFHRAVVDAVPAGETRAKLERFFSLLAGWRAQAREGRIAELIWRIYRETGFYEYAGALPGGAHRQARLRALYDRACAYEETGFSGLFDFLRRVENLSEGDGEAGEGEADAVRVMSIHKSKGLEFPVVFLAGLGHPFNLRDVRRETVLHKDLGIGPDVVDRGMGVRYPSWAKLAIREKLLRETLAEEMRILYVALTRARDKLVLVGSVRNLAARVREWGTYLDWPRIPLPDGLLLAAGSCLDWIGPAVIRHRDAAVLLPGEEREAPTEVRDDPSNWAVRCPVQLPGPDHDLPPADDALFDRVRRGEPLAVSPALAAAVESRLDWVYPYQAAVGLAAKIGVTELKRPLPPADDEAATPYQPRAAGSPAGPGGGHAGRGPIVRPRFLEEAGRLSELERGSAWHLVLQHLDLGGDMGPAAIAEQIRVMQENLLLTPRQAAVVDPALLARIFAGPLGRRIRRGKVRRELPFSLLLPADEVYPGLAGETVLVQGVIDCLVEEENGFLLVDWKTDRVPRAERYRVQLDVYARAVETILGRPVTEKYLYFLPAEEAVLLP